MFPLIRIKLNHRNHMIIATSTSSKRSVFKKFCSLRATSLGGGGHGGGRKYSLLFTPPRHQPGDSLLEVFCVHAKAQSRHFQMIYSFSGRCVWKNYTNTLEYITEARKKVFAWLERYIWLDQESPPPSSPAVYNLLLTREEGTICSWNHRCERDWCLQIAIRKDWFQIERIPGQRETGLCTYGTQAPTGYHCPLLWL